VYFFFAPAAFSAAAAICLALAFTSSEMVELAAGGEA